MEENKTINLSETNQEVAQSTEEKPLKKETTPKKKATAKKTTKDEKNKTTSSTKKNAKKNEKTTDDKKKKVVNTKKVNVKKVIDPRTGQIVVAGKKQKTKAEPKEEKEIKEETVVVETKEKEPIKKTTKKSLPKKSSKELTIEVPKREPVVIVRPAPKKTKELNKEEKAMYKQLDEAFSFVANLTAVIEDRTMDRKAIPDLAIGELHVIETVNKNNNKPMSLIANKEHVTVGALTICVNRLVQKGYLLRTRDEMDHRVILLSVTPKAKKVLKLHDKFHSDILGLVLENVNLSQATKVLTQFAHILEIYYDPTLIEKTKKK